MRKINAVGKRGLVAGLVAGSVAVLFAGVMGGLALASNGSTGTRAPVPTTPIAPVVAVTGSQSTPVTSTTTTTAPVVVAPTTTTTTTPWAQPPPGQPTPAIGGGGCGSANPQNCGTG